MDKIWISNPGDYSEISNESRKYVLYPKLKSIIRKLKPATLLDYGSGDGSFINFLKPTFVVGAYDISRKAISLAKKNVKSEVTFYNSKSSIPSNYFDIVNFSLVLMTIPTKKSIVSTLKEIKRVKRDNGLLIMAITHPCFRKSKFSSFYNDFDDPKKYNYFFEGVKFRVNLVDIESNKEISFSDYHWSLSFTLNTLISNKYKIISMSEIQDWAPKNKYYNKNSPPYLVLICK